MGHDGRAIFLGCHQRVVDLAVHLDICKWSDYPAYVIYTGPEKIDHPEPMKIFTDLGGLHGAGFPVIESLKWAKELGLKKICYRNADDWLFNRSFLNANMERDVQCQGYSWFNCGGDLTDLTINELYFDVDYFYENLELGGQLLRGQHIEYRMGEWVRRIGAIFHRLSGRERPDGVGRCCDSVVNCSNDRWWNRGWQLLAHHDLDEKYKAYQRLRPMICGVGELERMPRFANWLTTTSGVNMGKETSKSFGLRESLGDYKRYLHGSGIDVGCGDDLLKTPSGKVVGWDRGDGDAVFMKGVPDNHFNFVFSSHCLEHVGDVPKALDNWLRIVKPFGYVYIVVPDYKLYEKCRWPSSYNHDHKSSFSLHMTRKEVGRENHYHIYHDLLSLVAAKGSIVESRLEDSDFDYSMSDDVDQTRGSALCQICLVIQKNP